MNQTIEVPFKLYPTTARFFVSNAKVRGIKGPIGSGKSSICCMEIMRRAIEGPPDRQGIRRSKWVAIRNTYRELEDTTLKTWLAWFPAEIYGKLNRNEFIHHVRFSLPDKTKVYLDLLFRALDRPDDIKKLKSLDLTGGWINEAVEVPLSVLEMLEGRCGRYPTKSIVGAKKFWHGVIMDTNPPDTDHWWYKHAEEMSPMLKGMRDKIGEKSYGTLMRELIETTDMPLTADFTNEAKCKEMFDSVTLKYDFFNQPSGLGDNAENLDNLPDGYYMTQAVGKNQEWVRVFLHGEYGFVSDGKPVYPEYKDAVHYNERLVNPDSRVKTILRGWDGGRTPAVEMCQMLPNGRLFAIDELCVQDMGLSEFADLVKAHCAAHYPDYKFIDYCDPSIFFKTQLEDRSAAMILQAKGIKLNAGIQSPTIRKESVRKVMRQMVNGQPMFQIGPKCKMLRKGLMGGYQYKRKQVSGERYMDSPDKNEYSHPTEAFEYLCTKLFAQAVLEDDFDFREIDDELEINLHDEPKVSDYGRNAVTGY